VQQGSVLASPPRNVEIARLTNGIPVVTERMAHVRSIALGVWVASGSRAERGAEHGVSHFLEHMLFKGSDRRTAEDLAREVDSIGGHLDAFTGKELAGYNMKVLDEHLPAAIDILADLVLRPRLDAAELEREKGVVLEELKMEADNPEYLVHEMFVSNFWRNHGLGASILGTRKSIRGFTRELIAAYHQRVYVPRNLLITAAGNFEHAALTELLERHFGGHPAGGGDPAESAPAPSAAITLKKKRTLQQVQLCLGMPALEATHPGRHAAFLLNTLLGGGMSSRLFQNIRERRGLAYSVYSELSLYRDTGSLAVYAGTSRESIGQVIELILDEFRQLKREGATAAELRRAKDNMKGSMMLSLESTGARMASLARQYLHFGRIASLDEMLESIEAAPLEAIQQLSERLFDPGRLGVAVLGPIEGFSLDRSALDC
jgi:predicted Zn-dependent peptidase